MRLTVATALLHRSTPRLSKRNKWCLGDEAPSALIATQVHLFQRPDVVVRSAAPALCAVGELCFLQFRERTVRCQEMLGSGEVRSET